MKKFLINLLYFIAPIILMAYFLDIFISKNLLKSNFYAQKEYSTWNDLFNGKVNSDVVIYGSSRAWVHLSPQIISDNLKVPSYNLGIDGHNFWLQYLRHKLLLKYNTKPKLIIHSLDVFTLQKKKELYNSEQFLPYMLYNKELEKPILDYEGFKKIDLYIPLIRYYGKHDAVETAFKMFLFPKNNPIEKIRGYQGQDEIWNSDFDIAQKTIKDYKSQLDKPSILLFEKYIQECKENKIKIIFVYTPEYIEGQNFVKNREEILKLYNQLSKKYSIPFYDYSNNTICSNRNYFYNASHLNRKGAELFTNQFIKTIIKNHQY